MLLCPSFSKHDCAVVYQFFWGRYPGHPVLARVDQPILFSIATLRARNPIVPVYVIDSSESSNQHDWQDFPKRLDFTVVPQPCSLHGILPQDRARERAFKILEMAARPIEIWTLIQGLPHHQFLYSDADMLWLKNPTPFPGNSAYFNVRTEPRRKDNPLNNGLFTFDRRQPRCQRVFNAWIKLTFETFADPYLVDRMLSLGTSDSIQDELVLHFVYEDNPGLFEETTRILEKYDSFCPLDWDHTTDPEEVKKIRAVHLQMTHYGGARGRLFLLLRETRGILENYFTKQELGILGQTAAAEAGKYRLEDFVYGIHVRGKYRAHYEELLKFFDNDRKLP